MNATLTPSSFLSLQATGQATQAPASGSAGADGAEPKAPEDRSTTFQPVEGGAETRSGTTLMVEAYAVIWLILFAWIVFMWRKQAALNARLAGLEAALDRAARKPAPAASVKPGRS